MSKFIKLPIDKILSFRDEIQEILLISNTINPKEPLGEEKQYELSLRVLNLLTDIEEVIHNDIYEIF